MANVPILPVFNMTLSGMAPLVIPQLLDFSSATSIDVDLSNATQAGSIDFISGAWVDNSSSADTMTITVVPSGQELKVQPGFQGYFPLLCPNDPKFTVSYPTSPGTIIPIYFHNIPLLPYSWFTGNSAVTGTIVQRIGVAYTNRSIAALSGASEVLMPANASRSVLIIQNIASHSMGVNMVGGAAAIGTAGTLTIPAGGSITFDNSPPLGTINIIGTAADSVTAYEG